MGENLKNYIESLTPLEAQHRGISGQLIKTRTSAQ